MNQEKSFVHPSGALTRVISSRKNAVRVFDQTVTVSETGRWLLGSGGVEPISARGQINALLVELIGHGLASQIAIVYVNPLLGCSLVLHSDIPFEKLPGLQVSEDQKELSFGRLVFDGTEVEVIVMSYEDLYERFERKYTSIVVTDSMGEPLS